MADPQRKLVFQLLEQVRTRKSCRAKEVMPGK